MNTTLVKVLTLFAMTSGLLLGGLRVSAQVNVSVGVEINAPTDFYAPLTPEGAWVDVGSYGRCWRPTGVAVDWQPYCNGSWVWTDCGWYWQSDEPWAWACYHYGSWVFDPDIGWVWIPGTEWAPAWVVWRMGGDHIGWAPCGPGGRAPEPSRFLFVDSRHFNGPISRSTVVINDPTIIRETKVYGGPRTETHQFGSASQRVAVNNGPGIGAIEKVTGQKFTARPVQDVDRQTRVPETMRAPRNETPQREMAPAVKTEPKAAPAAPNRENVRTPETPPERRPENQPPGDVAPGRNVEPSHESPPPEGNQNVHKEQPENPPAKPAPATRPAEPSAAHPAAPPEKGQGEQKGGERPAPEKDKDKDH